MHSGVTSAILRSLTYVFAEAGNASLRSKFLEIIPRNFCSLRCVFIGSNLVTVHLTKYLLRRHAVQLLTPASIVAKTNGREQISKVRHPYVPHVSFVYLLFHFIQTIYILMPIHLTPLLILCFISRVLFKYSTLWSPLSLAFIP